MIRYIIRFICIKRAVDVVSQIEKYLNYKAVIDIGCGLGAISYVLNNKGYDVSGLDNINMMIFPGIKFIKANAEMMPFADSEFDVAIMHTMLHHSRCPEKIICEAKRVAKRIIIGEELVIGRFNEIVLKFYDSIINMSFVGHPHNNRRDREWLEIFRKENLEVIATEYSVVFGFIRQAIYVLEKQ